MKKNRETNFFSVNHAGFLVGHPSRTWSHEECLQFIDEAIQNDIPASRDLIAINARLAFWEQELGIGKVSSFPFTNSFNLTDVCNARCSFCAYVPERLYNKTLSFEVIKSLDWLKFSHTLSFNAGLGEPMVHPQFADVIHFCRDNFPFLKIRMISNGSMLSDNIVESIVGYLYRLNISLNAARKETYTKTMKLSWYRTIKGLERLNERKISKNEILPNVSASYVLHKENVEELPDLPKILRSVGINRVFIHDMIPPSKSWSQRYPHLLTNDHQIHKIPSKANKFLSMFADECRKYDIKILKPLPKLSSKNSIERCIDNIESDILESDTESTMNGKTASGTINGFPTDIECNRMDDEESRASRKSARSGIKNIKCSEEFKRQISEGYEPTCLFPWRVMRVDVRNRIGICCQFFQTLPEFDWLPAKKFHEGAWNHPQLQHLRRTMSTPDEVPFCTLCKTKEKRSIKNAAIRKKVIDRSKRVFEGIIDKMYQGTLGPTSQNSEVFVDGIVATSDFNHKALHALRSCYRKSKEMKVINLFHLTLKKRFGRWFESYYYSRYPLTLTNKISRQIVRDSGFFRLGDILQIGVNYNMTPVLLAEGNNQLTIMDNNKLRLRYARNLLKRFNLSNIEYVLIKDFDNLNKNAFEGIWLEDFRILIESHLNKIISELYRVSKSGGFLHIPQYRSKGRLMIEDEFGTFIDSVDSMRVEDILDRVFHTYLLSLN